MVTVRQHIRKKYREEIIRQRRNGHGAVYVSALSYVFRIS